MLSIKELKALSVKVAENDKNLPDNSGLGSYGRATGVGAGVGLVAGIPTALLTHALFSKKRGLRDYLKSGLLGALIGGVGGGIGAAGLKALINKYPELQAKLHGGLEGAKSTEYMAPEWLQNIAKRWGGYEGSSPWENGIPVPEDQLAAARRGEVGIPGITLDSYGIDPYHENNLRNNTLSYIQKILGTKPQI